MDITEYFRTISLTDHVMYVEMSGFWSNEVATQVGKSFLAQFTKAVNTVSAEGRFVGLADLTHLAVLSREGRVLLSQAMRYAKDHGLHKVVEVIPGAITTLSVREAAELTGKDDFRVVVKSLGEALPIVDQLVDQIHSTHPTSLLALNGRR